MNFHYPTSKVTFQICHKVVEESIKKISCCRVCSSLELQQIHDFGEVPLADKLADHTNQWVPKATLSISFCTKCYHLQVNENVHPSILFKDNYPYYSSKIPELRVHFKEYAQSIADRYNISHQDLVLEIASNDGLLLNYFKKFTTNVLGVDPSKGPVEAAMENGIQTRCDFFDKKMAKTLKEENFKPRLIIANNVLAHVPDPRDFAQAVSVISTDDTVVIVEVPHLLPMIQKNIFDVIFHQHYSYFSLHSLKILWQNAGLYIHHLEKVNTQGGSLRLHLSKKNPKHPIDILENILLEERQNGILNLSTYINFSKNIEDLKEKAQIFLSELIKSQNKIVGYGAPGKAATLLNYFGIDSKTLNYLVDISPSKQGKFFPNAYLPIYPLSKLDEDKPDYILILSWNYADTIIQSMNDLKIQGTKFILLFPTLRVI